MKFIKHTCSGGVKDQAKLPRPCEVLYTLKTDKQTLIRGCHSNIRFYFEQGNIELKGKNVYVILRTVVKGTNNR